MRYLTAEVKTVSDDGPGAFEVIASAPSLDREGEIIDGGAFSPLPKRVPVHVDHRMSSEGIVGSGEPVYDGGRLLVLGTFAGTARAQEVRQLVREGHLGHVSVGFMAATRTTVDGVPHITRAELLEVSFVTVSANREAVVLAAKGSGPVSVAEVRRLVTKAQMDLARVDLHEAQRVLRRQTIRDAKDVLRRTR